jgi:chemotaxis regulatin CheY-phosphate phosphatase CheZ
MADEDLLVEIRGTAQDLQRATREAVRGLRDVGREAQQQTVRGQALAVTNQRTARSFDDVGDEAREAARSVAVYGAASEAVRIRSRGVSQGLRDVGINLRAIGWTTALANVGPLSTGLTDLAAGAVAAAGALAPLAGTVATLPALLGAGGQAAAVAAIAFHGLEDALKGDADALAALDPAQRRLVDLIRRDLTPEIQKLQDTVRDGFLPGFSEFVEEAIDSMPVVNRVLGATAEQMGTLSEQAARMLGREGFQRDLERFGLSNVELLGKLGRGGLHAADGIRHVSMAAEPLAQHLGDLVEEGGRLFDQWATEARRSGDLADFFDLTRQRVDETISILGNLGGVLGSLVSGSQPLSDSLMSSLVRDTQRLQDIVSSPEGQRSLRQFFAGARQPLAEVTGLVGDLAVAVGDLGVDSRDEFVLVVQTLRQDVLPALRDLAGVITEDLLPPAVDLADSLIGLGRAAAPGLEPVVDAAGDLATALADVADFTADITEDLPGMAKLVPALAIGGGTLAGWRLVRDVLQGTRGRGGRIGGTLDLVFGKGGLGSAPTNPMWVAMVNAPGGGRGGPGGPVVAPTGPGERTRPGETRTRGGVILPPGVQDTRTPPRPGVGARIGQVASNAAKVAGAATRTGPLIAVGLTHEAISQATRGWDRGISVPIGGRNIIREIERSSDRAVVKIQKVGQAIKHLQDEAHQPGQSILDPKFGKAIQDLERYRDELVKTEQTLAPLRNRFRNLVKDGDTKGLSRLAEGARYIGTEFPKAASALQRFANRVDDTAQQSVKPQFQAMRRAAGESLETIERTTSRTSRQIARKLDTETTAGKEALAKNFRLAAQAVQKSMDQGRVSTEDGLAAIERLMRRALAQYGITGKEADRHLSGRDTKTGKPLDTGPDDPSRGMAKGGVLDQGLHMLGRPGTPGRDRIPMMLNGQPVIAAEGETVAVLNRHQRRKLDMLAGGDLEAFIKAHPRPNHMAAGGVIEAAGGVGITRHSFPMVSGDTDFLPALGRALSAMARSTGTPISVKSGGRTLAEQAALFQAKGAWSPSNPGAAPPSPNAPHVRGIAADIAPGVGVFGGVAGRFGLGFPMGNEPWHIQLIGQAVAQAIANGQGFAGIASTMDVPKLKRVLFAQGLGTLGAVGQAGLDQVRAAAQEALRDMLMSAPAGGAAGAVGAGMTGPWVGVMRQIAQDRGWSLQDWMWIVQHESGGQVGVSNREGSGAFGLGQLMPDTYARYGGGPGSSGAEQIAAMARYIADRYGNPTSAKAFWQAHQWYNRGGVIEAASGFPGADVIIGLGDPKAPPKAPDKDKTKRSRGAERRGRPSTSGPRRPDLSKAKPVNTRRRGRKPKPVPQWIKDLLITDGQQVLVPDFEALFGRPIDHQRALIDNLSANFDLSEEQATVTLYDSDQYRDLSNWLAAHPEDLAGAKNVEEFKERYGNGLEVVNQDGMTVQGVQVRGINQRVDEIKQLLSQYTGTEDGSGQDGVMGLLAAYLDAMTVSGPGTLNVAEGVVDSYLKQLREAWEMRREDLEEEREKLRQLNRKGTTVDRRIGTLQGQKRMLEDYKRRIGDAAVGHKLTDEGERNRRWADEKIADINRELADLQAEYGDGEDYRLLPDRPVEPKEPGPGASSAARARYREQRAQYRKRLARWERRQRRYTRMLEKSHRQIDFDERTIEAIDRVRPGWEGRKESIDDKREEFAAKRVDLVDREIPGEQLNVKTLQLELAEWLNTRIAPRPLDDLASAGQSERDAELARLLREQAEERQRNLAISQAQYTVLRDFAQLAGRRVLGSFLHGTDYVPRTGLYELHEGERVVTNPRGPFGSQLAPDPAVAATVAPVINLYIEGDAAPLMKRVRAEVDGRAARVSSQQIGRQRRLIVAAPGGGS